MEKKVKMKKESRDIAIFTDLRLATLKREYKKLG